MPSSALRGLSIATAMTLFATAGHASQTIPLEDLSLPEGFSIEVFASGIRNSVGFDWHPSTDDLWFTSNGRDGWGDDRPPDTLNHAPRGGGCISAIPIAMEAIFQIPSSGRGDRAVITPRPREPWGLTLPLLVCASTPAICFLRNTEARFSLPSTDPGTGARRQGTPATG